MLSKHNLTQLFHKCNENSEEVYEYAWTTCVCFPHYTLQASLQVYCLVLWKTSVEGLCQILIVRN